MKRKDLVVGQVLAYQPSKFGAIEAAVVMGVESAREQHTHGGNREKVVPTSEGKCVHVALLYSGMEFIGNEHEVVVRERAVPLSALRGDWWEVTEAQEVAENTRGEFEAKQLAAASAAQGQLGEVAAVLAKIGVEAKVTANFRLVLDLADAELLASWIQEVLDAP